MMAFSNHLFSRSVPAACAGLTLLSAALAAGAAQAGPMRLADLGGAMDSAAPHSQTGRANNDIIGPSTARDPSGNVYGTTASGGTYNKGTVYRLARDGTKTVLYSFAGGPHDGATPVGDLVLDRSGHVYGTTSDGGVAGCGTVFEISSGGEKILHAFTAAEGRPSLGVLHADAAGNLYGATSGEHEALFRLALDGTLTILFQFA